MLTDSFFFSIKLLETTKTITSMSGVVMSGSSIRLTILMLIFILFESLFAIRPSEEVILKTATNWMVFRVKDKSQRVKPRSVIPISHKGIIVLYLVEFTGQNQPTAYHTQDGWKQYNY